MLQFILWTLFFFVCLGGGLGGFIKAVLKGAFILAGIIAVVTTLIILHVTKAVSKAGQAINSEVSGWSAGSLVMNGAVLVCLVTAAGFVVWKVIEQRREEVHEPPSLLADLQAQEIALTSSGTHLTEPEKWRLSEIQHDIRQLRRGNRPDYHQQ